MNGTEYPMPVAYPTNTNAFGADNGLLWALLFGGGFLGNRLNGVGNAEVAALNLKTTRFPN